MTKEAVLKDGTILEFPDNTPDEVMDRAVRAHVSNPKNDSRMTGFVGGAVKPVDNIAALASKIPVIGPAVDRLGQSLGMPSTADAVANNDAMRANNSRSGYQILGNMAGTLPLSRLPGGPALQGAAGGALLSDAKDPMGIAADVVIGAVGGKAGQGLADMIGSAIAPRVSAGARRLANAGVLQTPGQILAGSKSVIGRALSKGEEALASVPYLGDMINLAREGGTEAYNVALGNRVLGNLGRTVSRRNTPGPDFVGNIRRTVSNEYERLVPQLEGTYTQKFADGLARAKAATATLPTERQTQFESIIRDVFTNRSQGSKIAGQNLKDAESSLTRQIGLYAKSPDGDQRALGEALKIARDSLREMVTDTNPAHGRELAALNKAWAQLKPMQRASEAAPDGVITPQRMFQANRQAGQRNDPLVRTAAARLSNRTPDSGTVGRALRAGTATGLGIGAAINPAMIAPALGAMLYSKAGMRALNKAVFAPRGPVAKAVAEGARALPALVPAVGPIGLMGLLGRLGE